MKDNDRDISTLKHIVPLRTYCESCIAELEALKDQP